MTSFDLKCKEMIKDTFCTNWRLWHHWFCLMGLGKKGSKNESVICYLKLVQTWTNAKYWEEEGLKTKKTDIQKSDNHNDQELLWPKGVWEGFVGMDFPTSHQVKVGQKGQNYSNLCCNILVFLSIIKHPFVNAPAWYAYNGLSKYSTGKGSGGGCGFIRQTTKSSTISAKDFFLTFSDKFLHQLLSIFCCCRIFLCPGVNTLPSPTPNPNPFGLFKQ